MKTLILDYETYYDDEYSLRKMTPVEYILDPRFEVTGCAFKEGVTGEPYWVDGPDLPAFFREQDPDVTLAVSHNALFDACISAWRYGFVPRLTTCTLSVSRAVLGHKLKALSLNSVAMHLGLGAKTDALIKAKGMRLADIKASGLYDRYVEYAKIDADLCAGIFDRLVKQGGFPVSELVIMNSVIRCATKPRFLLDSNVLAQHAFRVAQEKEQLLARIGVDKKDLMSNDKFAGLLRAMGVEPPMKTSPVTGKQSYAFAKTDTAFLDLQEHPNPQVQALVAARFGHKSTLEETRTARLINIANLQWPAEAPLPTEVRQGWMPIPLKYSGAHTHRLSGDWDLNAQNWPRGGELRRALIAPPGYKVVSGDKSQVEARLVAVQANEEQLVRQFADGEDVYSSFATTVFGYPVNKSLTKERFVGKQAILGLGYGLGWMKFMDRLATDSENQLGFRISLEPSESQRIVNTYRNRYTMIPRTWRMLNDMGIPALASGADFTFGACRFELEAIVLPNGMRLFYHELRQQPGDKGLEWVFTYGGKLKRLYGGKLLENITQAIARIDTMEAAMRIEKRLDRAGIELAHQVHDELIFVVPDRFAEVVQGIVLEEMRKAPAWLPQAPLAAEVGMGLSYGEAK